jgi:phosphoribosylaminoimidazolecarboxamide formyltransferase/IMP cyclohydrolase
MRIKRALLSVSDKRGIVELARFLHEQEIEIISTGGTYKLLKDHGIEVTYIRDVTGFPEILDGRVKTLHPKIHSGLLAKFDDPKHQEQLKEFGIEPIELVVVNLYPFQQTISIPDVTFAEAIENIDIGGPTMLRSAAKNHQYVTVVVDPADYEWVIEQIRKQKRTDEETRRRLAAKVFRHTAAYDALIAEYLTKQTGEEFPERLTVTYERLQELRYGENPHQHAAFYRHPLAKPGTIPNAKQLQGKELSYNNIQDAESALQIALEYSEPAAVVVKHMNPCGVAVGATIEEAFRKAYEADPVSIFGGIVALNRPVSQELAHQLKEIFLEIILAPSFTAEAREILSGKKNLRLLELDHMGTDRQAGYRYTGIQGGLLVQTEDRGQVSRDEIQVVTERQPTEEEWKQLLFAWKVVKHVKSNAIVVANHAMTLGVGAGQMNRVGAAKIALEQAGEKARGAVLASDAFFPMPDTVQAAAAAGITAIIQPGGSIKDQNSIAEADRHGIAMVFTGMRHFKH